MDDRKNLGEGSFNWEKNVLKELNKTVKRFLRLKTCRNTGLLFSELGVMSTKIFITRQINQIDSYRN